MRVVHIDLRGVRERAGLHERLRTALSLPEWYGCNLDALYDLMSEPAPPLHVHILCGDNGELEHYVRRVADVLRDAGEDGRISVLTTRLDALPGD